MQFQDFETAFIEETTPEDLFINKEMFLLFRKYMLTWYRIDAEPLIKRFGLMGNKEHTYSELALIFDTSATTIRKKIKEDLSRLNYVYNRLCNE